MSITSNFPSVSSLGSETYLFTSDGSVTLEAGVYYILLVGGGGGGARIKYYTGSTGSAKGASGAYCKGFIVVSTTTTVSFTVGKGGTQATVQAYSYNPWSYENDRGAGPGGDTTLTYLNKTIIASGGTGYRTKNGDDRTAGKAGTYTIPTMSEIFLEGVAGIAGDTGSSGSTSTTYNGGIEYNGVLYGGGGASNWTAGTIAERDGLPGCIVIIKA